jgi:hypothetical protein
MCAVHLQELEGAHMAAAEELEALFEKRMEVSSGREGTDVGALC